MLSKNILGIRIHNTTYAEVCDHIQRFVRSKHSGYVIAANVHVVMTAYWSSQYRSTLRRASIVVPDGMPLVWGLSFLCANWSSRVYGPDLMLAVCELAASENMSVYLYGSTTETLSRLSDNLCDAFPLLKIVGTHSPPFRPLSQEEERLDRERIQGSGASIVFVGLGCPKQEEWMLRQVDKLNVVMIGVGAAFKFHSGELAQAPRWMMQYGFEWLFRLFKEPGRLWSRYLLTNTAFLFLFSFQVLRTYIIRSGIVNFPKIRKIYSLMKSYDSRSFFYNIFRKTE